MIFGTENLKNQGWKHGSYTKLSIRFEKLLVDNWSKSCHFVTQVNVSAMLEAQLGRHLGPQFQQDISLKELSNHFNHVQNMTRRCCQELDDPCQVNLGMWMRHDETTTCYEGWELDPRTGSGSNDRCGHDKNLWPYDTVWYKDEGVARAGTAGRDGICHWAPLAEVSLGKDSEGPVYRNWKGQATGMALSTSRHRRMCSKPMLLAAVVVAACCLRMWRLMFSGHGGRFPGKS